MFFEINSHSDQMKANLFCAAVVIFFLWIFNSPIAHDPVDQSINGKREIIVHAGEYKTYYSLEKGVRKPFLITAIHPQRRRANPFSDHHSQFVTFSPSATRKYMKKYAGMTHCPANFLNRNAEHITLYAANSDIAETLSRWKQSEGSRVSRWEVVNLTGQCMDKRTKIERNGEDVTDRTKLVTIGRKASRDCHMIYVTGIERTDDTIQDFMRG